MGGVGDMGLEIRRLSEQDAAIYWHLRLEALEREPLSFAETPEEHRQSTVEDVAKRLKDNPDDNFVMGACLNGEWVGMAGFFRYQRAKARHKGRIWGVYLRQSCRGQGIGRALLGALLEQIRACPGLAELSQLRGKERGKWFVFNEGFSKVGTTFSVSVARSVPIPPWP
jgi:GNAT superfamily N-acetyltransferase